MLYKNMLTNEIINGEIKKIGNKYPINDVGSEENN